jgi:hypothetical protein
VTEDGRSAPRRGPSKGWKAGAGSFQGLEGTSNTEHRTPNIEVRTAGFNSQRPISNTQHPGSASRVRRGCRVPAVSIRLTSVVRSAGDYDYEHDYDQEGRPHGNLKPETWNLKLIPIGTCFPARRAHTEGVRPTKPCRPADLGPGVAAAGRRRIGRILRPHFGRIA